MRIHALRTGSVQIKQSQQVGVGHGLIRRAHPFLDPGWTAWLPTYAWVIEHPDGVIVVDTGSVSGDAHLRSWHPYHRSHVRFQVEPHEELGPGLRALGTEAGDVTKVVLTHLHMDHGAGLPHLPGRPAFVHEGELRSAQGLAGRLQGYLPGQWGPAFHPQALKWQGGPLGPFPVTAPLTRDGDVVAVPTPGHTPHHLSVVIQGETNIFLAGDASYSQDALLTGQVDGVSPNEGQARDTLARIRALSQERPLIYLPTHDPDSSARLLARHVVPRDMTAAG